MTPASAPAVPAPPGLRPEDLEPRSMTDRVLVMRQGKIVEEGATRDVFKAPQHPYTRLLLASIPRLRPQASRK